MKKAILVICVLLTPIMVSAKESVGKCNIGHAFRITDQYGKPLGGVGVSYVLKGAIYVPNRMYPGESSESWFKHGPREVNFSIPARIVEFAEDYVEYEFRFVKEGYFTEYKKDRIHKNSGYHNPIIRIEMRPRKKAKSENSHSHSNASDENTEQSGTDNSDLPVNMNSINALDLAMSRLAKEIKSIAVEPGDSLAVFRAMENENKLFVDKANDSGTLYVILSRDINSGSFSNVGGYFKSESDARSAIKKLQEGRQFQKRRLELLGAKGGSQTADRLKIVRQLKRKFPSKMRILYSDSNFNKEWKKLSESKSSDRPLKDDGGWVKRESVDKYNITFKDLRGQNHELLLKIHSHYQLNVIKPASTFSSCKKKSTIKAELTFSIDGNKVYIQNYTLKRMTGQQETCDNDEINIGNDVLYFPEQRTNDFVIKCHLNPHGELRYDNVIIEFLNYNSIIEQLADIKLNEQKLSSANSSKN